MFDDIVALEPMKAQRFYVLWNIGKRCNYACTYCNANLHDNTSPHLDLKIMCDTYDKIAEQRKGQPIRMWITGGEPTANPNLLDFITYVSNNYPDNYTIGLTTNGTRTLDYFKSLIEVANSIVFSTHYEYITGDLDKLLEKIKLAHKHSIKVNQELDSNYEKSISLNVMLEPNYWDDVLYVWEYCKKHELKHDLLKLHGGHYVYTDEQLQSVGLNTEKKVSSYNDILVANENGDTEFINSNKLILEGKNQFKNWTCSVGTQTLYIWNDGSVYRGSCRVGGQIGDIFNGFDVPTNDIVCNKNACTCLSDVRTSKFKTIEYKNRLEATMKEKVKEIMKE